MIPRFKITSEQINLSHPYNVTGTLCVKVRNHYLAKPSWVFNK